MSSATWYNLVPLVAISKIYFLYCFWFKNHTSSNSHTPLSHLWKLTAVCTSMFAFYLLLCCLLRPTRFAWFFLPRFGFRSLLWPCSQKPVCKPPVFVAEFTPFCWISGLGLDQTLAYLPEKIGIILSKAIPSGSRDPISDRGDSGGGHVTPWQRASPSLS